MIALFSAGLAPAIALLSFFYLTDKFELEPLHAILRAFLYGALLVFPIMFIQFAFLEEGFAETPFIKSYLLYGFLEEFFKWFIFMFGVYTYTKFDTVYDGIVYAVAISLGFASVENILYLIAHGIEVAFTRAIFPVSSHALFGVIMGYYLGKSKFNKKKRLYFLVVALFLPIVLHGTYDFILEAIPKGYAYALVPFMIGLWGYGLIKTKNANQLYHKQIEAKL
ncbi:glutamic-type intramembrane protease PrsW [Saliterribacillus persicus]|uniref:Protease PrsW n=1 Tax=Saliterribacillus persicus TaxID=930114 RepID=A0A368XAA8_9BACI|nr:glutamic-type intramembrane protease PrsW [Saliterribacillus persicus]RCW64893.1 RsiW-degrading membrane proteinase PrsW (M82 family) [Saliterribacillus persicus]